jgi:hypothetical protein
MFFAAFGIIAHFDDEQPAIFIKRHRHRIDHFRFSRRQFDFEPAFDLEGVQRPEGDFGGIRGKSLALSSGSSLKVVRGAQSAADKRTIVQQARVFIMRCQPTVWEQRDQLKTADER